METRKSGQKSTKIDRTEIAKIGFFWNLAYIGIIGGPPLPQGTERYFQNRCEKFRRGRDRVVFSFRFCCNYFASEHSSYIQVELVKIFVPLGNQCISYKKNVIKNPYTSMSSMFP